MIQFLRIEKHFLIVKLKSAQVWIGVRWGQLLAQSNFYVLAQLLRRETSFSLFFLVGLFKLDRIILLDLIFLLIDKLRWYSSSHALLVQKLSSPDLAKFKIDRGFTKERGVEVRRLKGLVFFLFSVVHLGSIFSQNSHFASLLLSFSLLSLSVRSC